MLAADDDQEPDGPEPCSSIDEELPQTTRAGRLWQKVRNSLDSLFGATLVVEDVDEDEPERTLLESYFGSTDDAVSTLTTLFSSAASKSTASQTAATTSSAQQVVLTPGNLPILDLPAELLDCILDHCSTASQLELACTCRMLQRAVDDDVRWRAKVEARFRSIIPLLNLQCLAHDARTRAQKLRYFALEHDWLNMVSEHHGMHLVRICGRVYDVTAFVDEHPGGRELILAASGGDATCAWQYVEHSEHACRILASHARPELDLVPEGMLRQVADPEWYARETRRAQRCDRAIPEQGGGGGMSDGGEDFSEPFGSAAVSLRSWSAARAYARQVGKQALESLLQTGDHAAIYGTSTRHQNCLSLLERRYRTH